MARTSSSNKAKRKIRCAVVGLGWILRAIHKAGASGKPVPLKKLVEKRKPNKRGEIYRAPVQAPLPVKAKTPGG